MATLNLKDATKVLMEDASGILEEATRVRKQADSLFETLRQIDLEMNQQKEEEAARRRQQAQQKAQSAHTKAFTMLDDDEKQLLESASQEAEKAPAPEPVKEAEVPEVTVFEPEVETPKKAPEAPKADEGP